MQSFSGDTDYSWQGGKSINSSLTNTGVNGDEVCKINDMASNISEWTTEYSIATDGSDTYCCTASGGDFTTSEVTYTSYRGCDSATKSGMSVTFRPTLYM